MRLSHLVASAHLKRRLLHRNTSLTIHQAASNSLYSNCISVESSNNHVRRHFSGTNKDQNGTNDLKETLNKINDEYEETKGSEDKNIPKQTNVNEDSYQPSTPSSFSFISSTISYVTENISEAFKELVGTNETNTLRRQVSQPAYKPKKTGEDEEEVIEYTGPKELVAVKEALSPWDQMKARLQDSPLIREILKSSKKIGDVAAKTEIGKKVKDMNEQVKDKIEDVREYLETSQDPITYTLTGVWENLTGESEEAIATSAIKKLDPNFVKELWAEEVRHQLAAPVIKAHLTGNIKAWKEWLGEAVYNKLSADIKARKTDGYSFDPNILGIDDNMIVLRLLDSGTPVVVVVYMVQQINCIRNREGEIVEGGESDLRAKFYSMAFQQEYDDETGILTWKIVDYEFAGDVPYVF